jgi:hypothetical protein
MRAVVPSNRLSSRPAVVLVLLVGVVLAIGVVLAPDAPPEGLFPPPRGDQRARAELLALLERADRASWKIESRFSRRLVTGSSLSGDGIEINAPPDHLAASFGSLTGMYHGRPVDCAVTASGPNCSRAGLPGSLTSTTGPGRTSPGTAARVRLATGSLAGDYVVRRRGAVEIGGETARCYGLIAGASARSRPFGDRSDYCLARDGLPLRLVIVTTRSTDRQEATHVQRGAGDKDLRALILGFDKLSPGAPASGPTTSTSVPSRP